MNPYEIIKEAVFTERSTKLSESKNVYTFKVKPEANKLQIKHAVETAFNVTVVNVHTINVRPKRRVDRFRGIVGKTRRVKKALVRLAPGNHIELV